MNEKQDTQTNHTQQKGSVRESSSENTLYSRIANDSIRYIQSEKRYLYLSVILPVIILVFQIANLFLVIIDFRILNKTSPRPRPIFDLLTPVAIIILVSVFMFIYLSHLVRWNSKVNRYLIHKELNDKNGNNTNSKEYVSLSQIFYDIVNHMRSIRVVFYILNAFSLLYLLIILREVLGSLRVIIIREYLFRIPWLIINGIAFIVVSVYLIIQWKYFLKWNSKLEKLEEFEKVVYNEMDFE